MALSPEITVKINLRAEQIAEERSRKIAKEELAKSRHDARQTNIRQELADLNQQLAKDSQLQHDLSEVLQKKDGYKTFYDEGRSRSCTGLPISQTLNQIAVMTTTGIKIVCVTAAFKRDLNTDRHTNYTEAVYNPLDPGQANVDGLFPKTQFKVGQLADDIAKIVLQSPNKK